jgi:hypothetical protein
MLSLKAKGYGLKDIVSELSTKYGCKEKTLYSDWENRDRWAPQILQLEDPNVVYEILLGSDAVLREVWRRYESSRNESVRIASLKLAKNMYRERIEFLRDLGSLKREHSRDERSSDIDTERLRRAIERMKPDQIRKVIEALSPFYKELKR